MIPQSKIFVIAFFLVLIITMAFPSVAQAGSIIGQPFTVSDEFDNDNNPAVAYNSALGEYLVVWNTNEPGNYNIKAQRLNQHGVPIGGPFFITSGSEEGHLNPDIAFDWTHDQYLVVWQKYSPAGMSIQGRRLSSNGELLGSEYINIKPVVTGYDQTDPKVEYAYTDDCFLVVWAQRLDDTPSYYWINAQSVKPDGALWIFTGVSSGEAYRGKPDIAYNRHMNRHLIVWEEYDTVNDVVSIRAQQIHGAGGKFLTDFGFLWLDIYDCYNPSVASIPTAPTDVKFLVVMEKSYDADSDIYGIFIEEDGDPVGDITLGDPVNDDILPAVAGSEICQEYFIVWQEGADIYNQQFHGYVLPSASLNWDIEYEFSGWNPWGLAITDGGTGDFLIVWEKPIPDTDTDIFGLLYGNREYLPLLNR